jgi:bifunctional ADP-heptose synthase (sugar kinase/adenylyltransferase)
MLILLPFLVQQEHPATALTQNLSPATVASINMAQRKVFVSGCYDVLHGGHVEFFEQVGHHPKRQC